MKTLFTFTILFTFILFGTACAPGFENLPTPEGKTPTSLPINSTSTNTPATLPAFTPSPTATLEPLTTACSPLKDIQLVELHSITSNTFSYPTPFSDIGHHGVDLAFFTYKDFPTMRGHPVQAILPGKVVEVVDNRFPYGNMILIETSLDLVSSAFLEDYPWPTPIPEVNIQAFSVCSKELPPVKWSEDTRSIYTLYAHLDSKPDFQTGDPVTCGQVIGKVGISGNSVADHLHIEVRVGPANAILGTISTYTREATEEERYNYCIWSVSGNFLAVDPARFWNEP